MRRRAVQTPAAQEDLIELYLHVAAERPQAADHLLARMEATIDRMRTFPALSNDRFNLMPGLRSVTVAPNLLFFTFDADEVLILRVVHGARDLAGVDLA